MVIIMKILLINVSARNGSVGRIVASLYNGLKARGNEVKVAYGRGDVGDIQSKDAYKIVTDFEVRIHALCSRLAGGSAIYYSKRATKKLIKWIDNYNPDVISIHGAYGYYLNMPILYSYIAKQRKQCYVTLHSCWDFTGHCCYFDLNECYKWKEGCHQCHNLHEYPKACFFDNTHRNWKIKRELYNSIDKCTIIAPSNWIAEYAKKSFLKDKKIVVINNGIDLSVFHKIERKKYVRPRILCIANVWDRRKGLRDVIELAKYAENKIELVVIGLSEKQLKELPDNVTGVQRTNNVEELIEYYNNSTVLFNPTYEDNYPTVNLEAIACHLPVITYDTGGCRETIKNGKYGVIVNKRDYEHVLNIVHCIFDGKMTFDYTDIGFLNQTYMVENYSHIFSR